MSSDDLPRVTDESTPASVEPVPARKPSGSEMGPGRGSGSGNGARILSIIALLVALVAAIASVYLWQRSEQVIREAARRWQDAETKLTQVEQQTRIAQDQVRDLVGRSAVLENRLADMSGQQAQLEILYKNIVQNGLEATLADVENAVSIASQQLRIGGNVQAAIASMQEAETGLKRADPNAVGLVQRLVVRDLDRLRALPVTDLASLTARIDTIVASIDQFPLLSGVVAPVGRSAAASADQPAAETAPQTLLQRIGQALQRAWNGLRGELQSLIKVNRVDTPDAVLLAPEQQYFVRENVRLALLSARLGLLARNDSMARADIERAMSWLNRYFDPDNRGVSAAVTSLRQIESTRLANEYPSLAETLAAVRAVRAARESGS